MVEELYLGEGHSLEGWYPPETLPAQAHGDADQFPLYGGANEIKHAVAIIQQNPSLYGLTQGQRLS